MESENISFENLTVLAGENGAGKSTVIQVLSILKQSHDIHKIPVKELKALYLNDYYCELGTFRDVLYCESTSKPDKIIFGFTDSNDTKIYFECIEDIENNNILKIEHIIDDKREKTSFVDHLVSDFDFISADRFGPKTFYHVDGNFSTNKVGKLGEYTGFLLGKLKTDDIFINDLNNELKSIFGFVEILPTHIDGANVSILEITNSKTKSLGHKSPVNMPYGVSYILPIIVSCLLRHPKRNEKHGLKVIENPVVVVENPEAHLHPKAQSKLGQFLAKMANEGVQIILETHSDHIINGIRIAIKNKKISNRNVLFNFFEKGEEVGQNTIREIYSDENGNLSVWPKGFFDQFENDLMDLM
jgi:predicted ATPase